MDVFEAISERKSIRTYTGEKVLEEDVKQLIEASKCTPYAGNIQPWAFVVIEDLETKRRLFVSVLDQTFIQKAPVVFVVYADITRSSRVHSIPGENLYCLQDTAVPTENILLAAQNMGLAICWVGAFLENKIAKVVKALKNLKPGSIVPVGYRAERPAAPKKKSVNEIVHYEVF